MQLAQLVRFACCLVSLFQALLPNEIAHGCFWKSPIILPNCSHKNVFSQRKAARIGLHHFGRYIADAVGQRKCFHCAALNVPQSEISSIYYRNENTEGKRYRKPLQVVPNKFSSSLSNFNCKSCSPGCSNSFVTLHVQFGPSIVASITPLSFVMQ